MNKFYVFILASLILLATVLPAVAQESEDCVPVSNQVYVTFGNTLIHRSWPYFNGEDFGNIKTEDNLGILVPLAYSIDEAGDPWLLAATDGRDSVKLGWIYGHNVIPYSKGMETSSFEERQEINNDIHPLVEASLLPQVLCLSQVEPLTVLPRAYDELSTEGWTVDVLANWNVRTQPNAEASVARVTREPETFESHLRIRSGSRWWYLIIDEGTIRFVGQ